MISDSARSRNGYPKEVTTDPACFVNASVAANVFFQITSTAFDNFSVLHITPMMHSLESFLTYIGGGDSFQQILLVDLVVQIKFPRPTLNIILLILP